MAHVGNAHENVYRYLLHHVPPRRKEDPAIHESINAAIEFLRSLESERPHYAPFDKRLSELAGDTRAFVDGIFNFGLILWFAAMKADTSPASKGYYRLLKISPVSPWAKLISYLAYRHGHRVAAEELVYGDVVRALDFVGKPSRRPSVVRKKIAFVLKYARETSVLDRILPDATEQNNFVELLDGAAEVGPTDQLVVRCAKLAECAKLRRGPKIRAASAGHQFAIECGLGGDRLYTFGAIVGDCNDPRTIATRLEFDEPRFDPRPAVRRAMAKTTLQK